MEKSFESVKINNEFFIIMESLQWGNVDNEFFLSWWININREWIFNNIFGKYIGRKANIYWYVLIQMFTSIHASTKKKILTEWFECELAKCARPRDILGIDGELNNDKSFILPRCVPWYCGSSFSSWIGALVGDPRFVKAGGELGPESGVLLEQSEKWLFDILIN